MGIEWFRDLSITILAFVTIVVLIFGAVIIYRLYRQVNSTLLLIQMMVTGVDATVTLVRESMKPVFSILTMVSSITAGFEMIKKMFIRCKDSKKTEGGNENE